MNESNEKLLFWETVAKACPERLTTDQWIAAKQVEAMIGIAAAIRENAAATLTLAAATAGELDGEDGPVGLSLSDRL